MVVVVVAVVVVSHAFDPRTCASPSFPFIMADVVVVVVVVGTTSSSPR